VTTLLLAPRVDDGRQPVSGGPSWRSVTDLAIAVAGFALLFLGVLAYARVVPDAPVPPLWLAALLGAAVTLPLAWRRRAPRTVLAAVTIACTGLWLSGVPEVVISSTAVFLALYTVGAELPPTRSRVPRAIAVTVLVGLAVIGSLVELPLGAEVAPAGLDRIVLVVFSVLLNLAFFAGAWVIGDLVWQRRAAQRALAQRAAELEATREVLALRAVQDERVRIARELHDVVAHHVSVMGIQAGAARRAITRDPEHAGTALASVEQASRDAVTELQRLLGFLRSERDAPDLPVPQPTLTELDDLLASVREAGLTVSLDVDGAPCDVPGSVELSAYRIVQEALTNTLKHAPHATRAEVTLRYGPGTLQVQVRDDGHARASADEGRSAGPDWSRARPEEGSLGGGRGLVGMRERAGLHGGTLSAGPTADGWFSIDASLPLRSGATA
jgi:signal transduction histidine kinase